MYVCPFARFARSFGIILYIEFSLINNQPRSQASLLPVSRERGRYPAGDCDCLNNSPDYLAPHLGLDSKVRSEVGSGNKIRRELSSHPLPLPLAFRPALLQIGLNVASCANTDF